MYWNLALFAFIWPYLVANQSIETLTECQSQHGILLETLPPLFPNEEESFFVVQISESRDVGK